MKHLTLLFILFIPAAIKPADYQKVKGAPNKTQALSIVKRHVLALATEYTQIKVSEKQQELKALQAGKTKAKAKINEQITNESVEQQSSSLVIKSLFENFDFDPETTSSKTWFKSLSTQEKKWFLQRTAIEEDIVKLAFTKKTKPKKVKTKKEKPLFKQY